MEDLFRSYWWLMFPLAWFVIGAWRSWLDYRGHRDTLDIIKSYANSGKEPPAGLLDKLNSPGVDENWRGYGRRSRRHYRRYYWRGYGGWPRVVMFATLAAGFGYAAWTDIYDAGEAFTIVTFVMIAMTLASLVATLTMPPPKD
ncbi:MAG: hypothetical protein Q8L66_11640 [Caulobacter sp.]|nr:hypothetical protein [Caulobacter sp.]